MAMWKATRSSPGCWNVQAFIGTVQGFEIGLTNKTLEWLGGARGVSLRVPQHSTPNGYGFWMIFGGIFIQIVRFFWSLVKNLEFREASTFLGFFQPKIQTLEAALCRSISVASVWVGPCEVSICGRAYYDQFHGRALHDVHSQALLRVAQGCQGCHGENEVLAA